MKLMELATVIRSKNASPFMTTLDLFFEQKESYLKVKDSEVLTPELIASLYKLPVEDVIGVWFVDGCQGIKISILKHYPSDHPLSTDLYGAQQNAPLLDVEI
ncbi:MAG TPA: DUF4387 domain-containing protein [Limnochordia bacterium]|nr:DUF4387 domain-containing protein [Limnochordia bacterium]